MDLKDSTLSKTQGISIIKTVANAAHLEFELGIHCFGLKDKLLYTQFERVWDGILSIHHYHRYPLLANNVQRITYR